MCLNMIQIHLLRRTTHWKIYQRPAHIDANYVNTNQMCPNGIWIYFNYRHVFRLNNPSWFTDHDLTMNSIPSTESKQTFKFCCLRFHLNTLKHHIDYINSSILANLAVHYTRVGVVAISTASYQLMHDIAAASQEQTRATQAIPMITRTALKQTRNLKRGTGIVHPSDGRW